MKDYNSIKKLQFALSAYYQERGTCPIGLHHNYIFKCIGDSLSKVQYTSLDKPLNFRTSKVFSMVELEELFKRKS